MSRSTSAAASLIKNWKRPDYAPVYARRVAAVANIQSYPGLLSGVKAYYKAHPVDFLADCGMTFDPRRAEIGEAVLMPFVPFPRQAECIDWIVARWRAREDGLIEKSRDVGLSWICVGVAVWMWLFHEDTVIGFGSRKEEYVDSSSDPKSLFWKIRKFIDLLPRYLKPTGWDIKKCAPYMRIQNPENNSMIVGEAGDNIGRGNRTSIYFKDESAFYERPELIDAALSQTSNCKIDLSTPNGVGNPFHAKRNSGRIPVFRFHWRDDPRKDEAWYQRQIETLGERIVAQEIDIDYAVAGRPAFDRKALDKLEQECYRPRKVMAWCGKDFRERDDGELKIWDMPRPGEKYVVGADVAEGLEHGDYSCADVLDIKGRQVAQYHGHCAPDVFGRVLYALGEMYGWAYMGVERNNHGLTTLTILRDDGYPNLHAEHDLDNRGSGDRETKKIGWLTTAKSKPLIIDFLDSELRNRETGIVCKSTVDEMRTFIIDEAGRFGAQENCYDDRVMARAIAGQMLKASYIR